MVKPCRCPYCGNEPDLPLYFSLSVQRVANFIVANPWCTINDIERGVYGRATGSNVVTNLVSKIRRELLGTNWRMYRRWHNDFRHQRQYRIIKIQDIDLRTPAHDNVQSPDRLP